MKKRIDDDDDLKVKPSIPPPTSKSDSEVSTSMYLLMLFLAIGIKSWQPLAIAGSKNSDGSYSWNKTTMVVLVEVAKLIFCSSVFMIQYFTTAPAKRHLLHNLSFNQSLHFMVPAILYGASNTLVYIGMSYINPALFHVFGNIRILTAGVLYRFMMGKKLSDLQWLALMMLTCGALLATPTNHSEPKEGENNFLGLMILLLMCTCSTASSIYTEINYKKTQELSIFYQNSVLYIYGIIVNLLWLIFSDAGTLGDEGLFGGFDRRAFVVLLAQSSMGVSLSFIFKYLDNIVYVISLTVSMFISAIFSIVYYDFEFTMSFGCALAIVTVSIYHYYRSKILEKYRLSESDMNF
jgi:UDP-galactose transporter